MARTTGLARAHANGTGITVEVSGTEIDDLAIPTASQKCALHRRAETGLAGIHEPLRLGVGQVANLRRTRLSERLDAAPSLIARGMPLAEGKVEGRLEHTEDAVGARPSLPHGVGILKIDDPNFLLQRRLASPQTGWRLGEREVPLPYHRCRQRSDFASSELQPEVPGRTFTVN